MNEILALLGSNCNYNNSIASIYETKRCQWTLSGKVKVEFWSILLTAKSLYPQSIGREKINNNMNTYTSASSLQAENKCCNDSPLPACPMSISIAPGQQNTTTKFKQKGKRGL